MRGEARELVVRGWIYDLQKARLGSCVLPVKPKLTSSESSFTLTLCLKAAV